MTTLKQLYCLQEVDLDLDGVNGQIAEVERELEGRLSLDKIEESLEEAKTRLQEIQSSHRQLQLETESQRERSSHLETQLYGGDVENPRDLEASATGIKQRPAHAGADGRSLAGAFPASRRRPVADFRPGAAAYGYPVGVGSAPGPVVGTTGGTV